MSDIFISYARKDKSRVEPLAKALVSHGWSVWWDPDIPVGKYFDEVIEQALKDARCIVVVWSSNSISSRWVRAEANDGVERGTLVPVLIDDVKIPLTFRPIQTARLIDWTGSLSDLEFGKLVRDISALLGPPAVIPSAGDLPSPETKSSVKQPEKPERKNDLLRLTQLFHGFWQKTVIASIIAALSVGLVVWIIVNSRSKDQGQLGDNTTAPPNTPADAQASASPKSKEPSTTTPDFTDHQLYLNPAPDGVDARYAWTLLGGKGEGVNIVFIGGTSVFAHEDLNQPSQKIGQGQQDPSWRNYEVAILGVITAKHNGYGVSGICPDATLSTVSGISAGGGLSSSSNAITQAADNLRPGDIILIEVGRPGPRHKFKLQQNQSGMIPLEWWPNDFAAISYATSRGIIVVEAAGNSGESLDDPIYDINPDSNPFPGSWQNPFRRKAADSGAIIVGAGAPPPTIGEFSDRSPDRSRLDFSNYGSAVDAQGWGREVTTTGSGDLQGGSDESRWYTDKFSGTGSAAAIVAGAIVCVQGVLRAKGLTPLSPKEVRDLLRSTGSPQEDSPKRPSSQRIGSRPNLRELIAAALVLRR